MGRKGRPPLRAPAALSASRCAPQPWRPGSPAAPRCPQGGVRGAQRCSGALCVCEGLGSPQPSPLGALGCRGSPRCRLHAEFRLLVARERGDAASGLTGGSPAARPQPSGHPPPPAAALRGAGMRGSCRGGGRRRRAADAERDTWGRRWRERYRGARTSPPAARWKGRKGRAAPSCGEGRRGEGRCQRAAPERRGEAV